MAGKAQMQVRLGSEGKRRANLPLFLFRMISIYFFTQVSFAGEKNGGEKLTEFSSGHPDSLPQASEFDHTCFISFLHAYSLSSNHLKVSADSQPQSLGHSARRS